MGYIDETAEEKRTVERLIQFMKAVENPSWMIELVEDMKNKVNMYENMRKNIENRIENIKSSEDYPHNFKGQMVEDFEWVLRQFKECKY